ncbi:deoxyguanosinetriphosphate triphosphohydrolase [Faecalibacterium sp. An192]|uniref:deoxyguanosinetriphosphate triphosphohydrolase n=1 Tax=Faecalibacterium sp. An192 TaxID=1965581 RepID=UPI000B384698|nr:deoxyguanosinetriphosphate triphosphohydrolase [Faecalibacterium sp. An192]OUP29212.1 deoxyguanosinetriphosphate triphosphohydrolase [Faecalibacterium sp. An192]
MDVRLRTEEIERLTFASWASFSDQSRGRARPEPQDPIRPVYQRDRDRIIHCKAFRRLKQKTQVFLSPEGDLYRTRLTHTLEVSQIARTIARALRLNEDLTEAIALAHDLGHTPFGHAGERALNRLHPGGFKHYEQSLRVVDRLEKDGSGLNLTWEVRNGIVTHTKGTWAATPEGRIVRMADQIAYVNHDIEDAVRAGVLDPAVLPREATDVLGQTKSARITAMINSILLHTEPGTIQAGPVEDEAFRVLKAFMYSTVYVDKVAKHEEQKVEKVIESLYEHYMAHTEQMSTLYQQIAEEEGDDRAVADYISGMSDDFAIRAFEELYVPKRWHVL